MKTKKAEPIQEERPRKKKKKKKSADIPWLLIGIIGGVLVLLLAIGGTTWAVVAYLNKPPERIAKNDNPLPQPPPPPPPPGGAGLVKNPKSLLGTIRGRGAQVERDNEMRQIALFFEQYCLTASSANARTNDGFAEFFKRDSNKVYKAVKEEKTYGLNAKARQGSDDIVAWETEEYTEGFYTVRANTQLGFVKAEQLPK